MLEFERLKDIFTDYSYIASAYLFGSQASGKMNPLSDVDIAVLHKDNAPKGRELIHEEDYLSYRIAKTLRVKEVDLIDLDSQGLIFQHNVLRRSKLIYDADPAFRVMFEVKVITEFCDFEPTLRFMEKFHLKGRIRRIASL